VRTLLSKRWSARFSAGKARAEAPAARLMMLLKVFMVVGLCLVVVELILKCSLALRMMLLLLL
jgi:hypothetical protein